MDGGAPVRPIAIRRLMSHPRRCRNRSLPGCGPQPRPLVLAVSAALWAMAQQAQGAPFEVDPRLVAGSSLLAATASAVAPTSGPETTRIEAERIDGRSEAEVIAVGQARMVRGETVLDADRLRLDQVTNDLYADGNVQLTKPGQRITGPRAFLNLDTYTGDFTTPTYSMTRTHSLGSGPTQRSRQLVVGGEADVLKLEGENQYRFRNATYSSCPAPSPDWYLHARTVEMDSDRNRGEATNATLWMKGVPIMWAPWAEFPLDGGRQSGLLPPTIGTANTTGLDINLPYYFNLAPNYDLTLAPRWMANRGGQLSGEFRYLMPGYQGVLRSEVMPQDKQTGESRSFTNWRQDYSLGRWSGFVDVSNASDEFYFADLGTRLSAPSQTLLSRQATTNTSGPGWSFAFNVQNFQTLSGFQGSEPYQRLPQLTGTVSLPDVKGLAFKMPAEATRFAHVTLDEGSRVSAYPQVSLPLEWPGYYLTPKVGAHLSQYQLDRRTTTGDQSVSRVVPSFTLDGGLNFERELNFAGKEQTQTLEPRLFYVRIPYRDQNEIPLFDSGLFDYNFAQLFAENRFAGNDRIGDANQLTAAVTSRLIETETGEEWLRATVGQRFHFADQRVGLTATTPVTSRSNDNWLAALSGRVTRGVWLDSAYEYDPHENRTQSGVVAARYTLAPGRVLSAGYRYRQGNLRDLDVSAQWTLARGYSMVGRYNYNLRDHRLSESLAGIEYNSGCWSLRFVWHSVLNTRAEDKNKQYTDGFMLQLQLDGLSSIGSNPLSLLRRSVGGYQRLDADTPLTDD